MNNMRDNPKIACCLVGLKGLIYLRRALELGLPLSRVVTYDQPGDLSASYADIRQTAASANLAVEVSKQPQFSADEIVFVVGWQFLFSNVTASTIVFHDSLLPRFRGFAPTVTALIRGEREIGITALLPVGDVDAGPIVGQASFEVTYPLKIRKALELQATLMADMSKDIVRSWTSGQLTSVQQDHTKATYSHWRDDRDYFIDWSSSAEEIQRFVDAVGFPYAGAKSYVNGAPITINSASVAEDMVFEIRQPGKVWCIEQDKPVVVCGSGMVKLDGISRLDGTRYDIASLRTRFEFRNFE